MDRIYTSISSLAKQCKQAWSEAQAVEFPNEYKNVNNIVFCGMGGSAYPYYIIKALYASSLPIPFELVNGYNLPNFVSKDSLVMLSSYSGSTEETLSCAKQALQRVSKITALTSGSKLKELVFENNLPGYIFDPTYNPSAQPRMGVGYMVMGFLGLLNKLGFLRLNPNQVIDSLENMTSRIEKAAKVMTQELKERIPLIIASEHLSGNAHILRNQFNETAKTFSTYSLIPELNHHLMEGLAHPKDTALVALFLDSSLYSNRNQKRVELTKDVIKQNKVEVLEVEIKGQTPFEQILYALSFGGFLTYYLAKIYGEDPAKIPRVDYFKHELEKA